MRPRIVSLCSGYGGLDLAVEEAFGAVTVAHCEWEAAPSLVLAHRWPGVPNLHDVKTADWSQVDAEILTAGYPCQPFSHAGQRKGTDDERHLWPHVAEAIRRVRPRFAVLENVAGHRSLGFGDVLGELAEDGYDAQWTSLRAADVGAPHGRERLFVVASDTRRGESRPGHDVDLFGRRAGQAEQARMGADPVTDAGSGPLPRPAATRDGLRLAAERRDRSTPDADGSRLEGRSVCRCGRSNECASWPSGGPGVVADADLWGREVGPELDGNQAPNTTDGSSPGGHVDGHPGSPAWGQYEPAIRRWEILLGRVAPPPTEPTAKGGQRLSARLVEFMMGLPAGWVTDVPGISRNDQLKMLGNGVVPQQAAEALRRVLPVAEEAA